MQSLARQRTRKERQARAEGKEGGEGRREGAYHDNKGPDKNAISIVPGTIVIHQVACRGSESLVPQMALHELLLPSP